MNAVAETTRYSPEDLLAMPDEKDFDLVDGQLVERNMGALSSWVGGAVLFEIALFLKDHPIGLVWGADNGYQCFPDDPSKVRKPDVSFVRNGRMPGDWASVGYVRIAPDLVVEVISTNDLALEVEQKVYEYQKAGVALVWLVNPEIRKVRVHRADGSIAWLGEDDELTGEDVLPGFRCRVGAIFPAPAAGAVPDQAS